MILSLSMKLLLPCCAIYTLNGRNVLLGMPGPGVFEPLCDLICIDLLSVPSQHAHLKCSQVRKKGACFQNCPLVVTRSHMLYNM